jgi:amino acid transporter
MYLSWFPAKVRGGARTSNLHRFDNLINHENFIYAPDTYAWAIGALFPAWIFKGFEVSIHLIEETNRASRSVAMAMWTGTLIGYVIGLPVIIVLLSCIQDFEVIAHAAHYFPQGFAPFLLDVVGHNGALAILALAWLDAALVTAVLFMTAQRLTFALARDQVLPLSPWISTVSKRQLPVNAAYVVFVYALLTSMVGVVGKSTFQALLAIAVVAQNLSYAIVIFTRLTYGRTQFQPAGWNLKRWSVPLNIVALTYSGYLFLILVLPFWFPVCAVSFTSSQTSSTC